MIRKVFEDLKEDIRKETAKHSVLLFFVKKWKRSHYKILSDIMNESLAKSVVLQGDRKYEIGSTISSSTLRRFFENDFNDNAANDLRFLKSLDKMSIFLGFKDFSDYSIFKEHEEQNMVQNEESTSSPTFCDKFFIEFILHFCEQEFNSYVSLPKVNLSSISDFVHLKSPLYTRLISSKKTLSEQGIILNNLEQRSNYEIYDIKKIYEDAEQKVYEAREFWFLQFENLKGDIKLYNDTNIHQYFFRKIFDEWKLWNNYNPNSGKIEFLFNT